MVTAAGSGYSRWQDLAITRWRADATRDDTGSYIFLRDVANGERWSAAFQPIGEAPESYDVSLAEDRAEFIRRDRTITTRLEVIVSPGDDAEVRRLSLTNDGPSMREIEVTSYAEIVLAPAAADAAHPAFSNLFIQTESVARPDTLLATRRRQTPEDAEIWLAHVLALEGETIGDLEWETDRGRFLGRGRRVRAPCAETDGGRLSNTVGSVLDPIVSLRRRVRVRQGETVRLAFSTLIAPSRGAIVTLADKYRDVATFDRERSSRPHAGRGPTARSRDRTRRGPALPDARRVHPVSGSRAAGLPRGTCAPDGRGRGALGARDLGGSAYRAPRDR